jgi:hypothetical protein
MHLHLDLIAGLPYEDLASFGRSFNAVYALQPHMLQLGFLKVLPGTRMAQKTAEYGLVYMPQPPYEILATKYLGTEALMQLKILSDVFDLTYNSGCFPQILQFLVAREPAGAFTFYQKLTRWWREQGPFWQRSQRRPYHGPLISVCPGGLSAAYSSGAGSFAL